MLNFIWTHLFEILTVILALLAAYLMWLQIKVSREKPSKEEIVVRGNMRVYTSRERMGIAVAELAQRLDTGDILFGQAATMTDFPAEFYQALPRAVQKGAYIKCLLEDNADNSGFIQFLRGLNSPNVEIRIGSMDPVRVGGIAGKEVLLATPFPENVVTVHFHDERISNQFYQTFLNTWHGKAFA